jgi:hypothetical protein
MQSKKFFFSIFHTDFNTSNFRRDLLGVFPSSAGEGSKTNVHKREETSPNCCFGQIKSPYLKSIPPLPWL